VDVPNMERVACHINARVDAAFWLDVPSCLDSFGDDLLFGRRFNGRESLRLNDSGTLFLYGVGLFVRLTNLVQKANDILTHRVYVPQGR
jgi:hypothetical protein